METRDVLLIESRPTVGRRAGQELAAAGHRVHRCYPPESTGFPCVALDTGSCPLDAGIDVAVLALDNGAAPTAFETGVSCALRAGVPVVTSGGHGGGTFASHLTERVSGGAAEAVEAGLESARLSIEAAVRDLAAELLRDSPVDPSAISVRMHRDGTSYRAIIEGPALDARVERAMCVRTFDVLRGTQHAATTVDIAYHSR